MKTKHLIFSGVVIAGVIVAVWFFWPQQPISKPAATFSSKAEDTKSSIIFAPNEANPKNTASASPEEDGPILFYGKLEDQAETPVVYASIGAKKSFQNGPAGQIERLFAKSDKDGFFKIEGGSGESIEIMPHE